jgi:hypothetical protein
MRRCLLLCCVLLVGTEARGQGPAKRDRPRPPRDWTRIWFRLPASQLGALKADVTGRLIQQGQHYLKRYPGGAFSRGRRRSSSIDTGGTTAAYSFGLYNPQLKLMRRGETLWLRVDLSNALRGQEHRQRSFETLLDGAAHRAGGTRVLRLEGK